MTSEPAMYMVFDVESIGLHGEGWAAGYVVIDSTGAQHGSGKYVCHPERAAGSDEGRAWVNEHCPPMLVNYSTPGEVRRHFWQDWQKWKARGAVLVADCAWPVEGRFLAACVDDAPEDRQWQGPYPLHELASFLVAAGMDPMASYERFEDEPEHDPIGDAKQSARLLIQALTRLRSTGQRD